MIQMDKSTINQKELAKLPIYKIPPTYHVDQSMGSGCYGDAPGYPSYFIQHVWTQYGNSPRRGSPSQVIRDAQGNYRALPDSWSNEAKYTSLLNRLFIPLPIDHLRVRRWIMDQYQHFAHCYGDPLLKSTHEQRNVSRSISWPVSKWQLPPRPDNKITVGYGSSATVITVPADDYRKMLTAYRVQVKAIYADSWRVAKNPENHLAVLAIRKFYPDYQLDQLDLDFIARPPKLFQADWWERYADVPSESECPGHLGTAHGKYSHCGMCGRRDIQPKPSKQFEAFKLGESLR